MQKQWIWDIFCRVIDNHGDLGVCWRLARQLRSAGQRVRLWVDEPSALGWMAPGQALQGAGAADAPPASPPASPPENPNFPPSIEIRLWDQASDADTLRGLPLADVWIEAFGCELPPAFVAHAAATRKHAPAWVNLEYLSAEAWVARMHGLPSPIMSGPAQGWSKRFFYPGFGPGTGGLLREADLPQRQQRFDRTAWRAQHAPALPPGGQLLSLFCYEPPGLPALLRGLAAQHLLVTPGRAWAAVQQALTFTPQPTLRWSALPYCTQDEFDHLLWACDLNLVRGEDSLVRALWAGQPLVWHIYPQHDQAHHAKLHAFLDWLQAPASLRQFHLVWNGLSTGELPPLQPDTLAEWRQAVHSARARLLAQPDLLSQLLALVPGLLRSP